MLFTRDTAVVMRQRLLLGLSVIDGEGNERVVAPHKARVPKGEVPSVEDLLARYGGNQPEPTETQAIESMRALVAQHFAPPERVAIDLAPLAAKAGLSPEELLAIPDEPRHQPAIVHPARQTLFGSRTPGRYIDAVCSDAWDTAPRRDVKAWLAGKGWGLILGGTKGTGKTVAAVAGMVQSGGGAFVAAEEIAAPSGRELAETVAPADYLVIDDTGDEALTDLGVVRFRQLCGTRHAANRRTVITTNLDLAAWAERYGSRLVDRFREGAGFKAYSGASLRGAR